VTKDTSTFIAASVDETIAHPSAPLLSRRVANIAASTASAAASKSTPTKEIRRDSKGFENFDDYFSDSEANETTMMASGEKTANNEEVEGQTVDTPNADNEKNVEENIQQPVRDSVEVSGAKEKEVEVPDDAIAPDAFISVPTPTETMPEEILVGDKDGVVPGEEDDKQPRRPPKKELTKKQAEEAKKSVLADLSKEWADEEEESGDDTPEADNENENLEAAPEALAAPEAAASPETVLPETAPEDEDQETIENIGNFIEESSENNKGEPSKDKSAAPGPQTTTGTNAADGKNGKKEEWVTVIFGEDGKQVAQNNPKLEKSVYDLDDEDFSTTKATPAFSGRGRGRGRPKKSNPAKKEGVTRIGMCQYAQSAHAAICCVITQPLATLQRMYQ
jgi:hypothetical protein